MRALLAALLATYLAALGVLLHVTFLGRELLLLGILTALSLALVAVLRRSALTGRSAAAVIVGAGVVMQLIALTHAPRSSSDAYRYYWDAKVQLHGIDPYRYAPLSPALRQLRDNVTFGPDSPCTFPLPGGNCTAINRAVVHTIYPPVAQAVFDLGRIVSFGGHGGLLVYQIFGALGASAVTVVLLRRRTVAGQPLWPVAFWAWSPIVVIEFANNAHVDWLGVLLALLALGASAKRRPVRAGLLAGAAIATKLYPGLIVPSMLRRRPWVVLLAAVGFVVIVYVPHLIVAGHEVLGYLPGYLTEEGYGSGSRLLLLGTVLPHPVDTVVGVLILIGTVAWVLRTTDPDAPEQSATLMTGMAILVTTPSYGWYAALLVALAVASSRYEWLVLAFAPAFVYAKNGDFHSVPFPNALVYFLLMLGTALAWWLRAGPADLRRLRDWYDERRRTRAGPVS